jgi:hypothetical protein
MQWHNGLMEEQKPQGPEPSEPENPDLGGDKPKFVLRRPWPPRPGASLDEPDDVIHDIREGDVGSEKRGG